MPALVAASCAPPKVADMRISYTRGGLEESMFSGRDPMEVFGEWFKAAVEGKVRTEWSHTQCSCDMGIQERHGRASVPTG